MRTYIHVAHDDDAWLAHGVSYHILKRTNKQRTPRGSSKIGGKTCIQRKGWLEKGSLERDTNNMYIYIYIYREREREGERANDSVCVCMYVCMYIYIYIHM